MIGIESKRQKTILISGAGIAGLSLALSLRKRRSTDRIIVLEKRSSVKHLQSNYGIQLTPNAIYVLKSLGLFSDLLPLAYPITSVQISSESHQLCQFSLKKYKDNYVTVARSNLIHVLVNHLQNSDIEICYELSVKSIDRSKKKVFLSDQSEIHFDFFVCSEGSESVSRHYFMNTNPLETRYYAYRQTLAKSNVLNYQNIDDSIQIKLGDNQHRVSYPVSDQLLNVVWVKKIVKSLDKEEVAQLFSVDDFSQDLNVTSGYVAPLLHLPLPRRYFNEWGICIGDSSHATLPFLAQGGAMALEDAWSLSAYLSHVAYKKVGPYFHWERARRIQMIQLLSRNQVRGLHLKNKWLKGVRNFCLRSAYGLLGERLSPTNYYWIYDYQRSDRFF